MDNPPDRQKWFEHLCRFSNPEATVHEHRDRGGQYSVQIFRGAAQDETKNATIGLMDVNQSRDPAKPVFTEILLDSTNTDEVMSKLLSTTAFHALKHDAVLVPGLIFEGVVREYFPDHPLPHLMLVAPFQWASGMTQVDLPTKTIYPLVAVPISEEERQLAVSRGSRAVEEVWAAKQVNVLDWARANAVGAAAEL